MRYLVMGLLALFLLGGRCSDDYDGGGHHKDRPVPAIPEAGALTAFALGSYLVIRRLRK